MKSVSTIKKKGFAVNLNGNVESYIQFLDLAARMSSLPRDCTRNLHSWQPVGHCIESNRMLATFRFYLRWIYVRAFWHFSFVRSAVNKANRMLDAFFMRYKQRRMREREREQKANVKVRWKRWKRWLDTNIVTHKNAQINCKTLRWIIKLEMVATDAATASLPDALVGHLMANQCTIEVYSFVENDCMRIDLVAVWAGSEVIALHNRWRVCGHFDKFLKYFESFRQLKLFLFIESIDYTAAVT